MKKLALAPAVALAITGLAASPVIAAPDASAPAPSADTQPAKQSSAKASFAKANAQSSGESTDSEDSKKLDAKVSVSPEKISQADLADSNKGVTVTITGLEKGDVISDDISFEEGETKTAEGDTYSYTIYNQSGDPAAVDPGTINFAVTVKRGDETQEISSSFEVTKDGEDDGDDGPEAPDVDPKVSLNTDEISQSDFNKNGIKVTGEGFTPNGKVTVVGGSAQSPFATVEVEADEEGKISATLKFDGEGDLPAGDYAVWGVDQESETNSPAQDFTITEDETEEPSTPAAEAKLTVSPETVSPADFVKEDKGVTLAVENCEPGEDVHYVVNPKGDSNVTAYDNTVKADDEGKANVNVYGTSASDPSAYIGDYEVTVTCGDDELTGEFSVSDDANAGGSDGDEDGSGSADGDADGGEAGDGGDLPRTGTELTGLVGGAGLLLIGGISVALTMRRKKTPEDPSEI
jgi:LPXTG-motif cell wall-anchored protein